jgi:phosphoribosylamine--glycine ligase
VIEYNTRFGDPETQVGIPRLQSDLLELLWAATHRTLGRQKITIKSEHALCVVIAAHGYPGTFPKGDVIKLPSVLPPSTFIYHAGTARNSTGQVVTNGGRVLGVTALAPTLRAAADAAYAACEQVTCATKYYRRDIGARQLNRS